MPQTLSPTCQAVILAGSGGSQLHPLNSDGTPKVLLPVGNRPLLSFPLRTLEDAGIKDVIILCEGEAAASAVQLWLGSSEAAGLGLKPEVIRVPEETSPVEALRSIKDRLRADDVILLSGDVVTEVPLTGQLLLHRLKDSVITPLLARRRVSAASETKPGQAPKNVDYIGLSGQDQIVYFLRSPDRARHLRLPARLLDTVPSLDIRTDLADLHVYIIRTAALLAVLAARTDMHHLGDHVVPFMVRQQTKRHPIQIEGGASPPSSAAAQTATMRGASSALSISSRAMSSTLSWASLEVYGEAAAGAAAAAVSAGGMGPPPAPEGQAWRCTAFIAPEGAYCNRASSIEAYADVNRDVASPDLAMRLLRESSNTKYDNYVHPTTQMGSKTTIGAGCMIGSDVVLGDKVSVKRSVIGPGCTIGAGAKIINSILMSGVTVESGCHLHNSIVCNKAWIGADASLRDCQVSPEFRVEEGADVRGEVLALSTRNI